MYDWNAPARLPHGGVDSLEDDLMPQHEGTLEAIDAELEAAIEYKLAISGFAGVAEVVELLNRSVRRRWVQGA